MSFDDSYSRLCAKKVDLHPLLVDAFDNSLKLVNRRITRRRTIRNSGKIIVKTHLHESLFVEFFKAVKNWRNDFGRTLSTVKDKKNLVKELKISFIHEGALKFHLGKVSDRDDVSSYLSKKFGAGAKGVIKITEANPFEIKYIPRRKELVVTCFYDVINRYSNICI